MGHGDRESLSPVSRCRVMDSWLTICPMLQNLVMLPCISTRHEPHYVVVFEFMVYALSLDTGKTSDSARLNWNYSPISLLRWQVQPDFVLFLTWWQVRHQIVQA
jgi:hypothetical protein